MKSKLFSVLLLLAAVTIPSSATAQAVAISAPISDVGYEVTFTRANAARRQVRSAMTFTVGGTEPVLLSLPAWTPGAYEIGNFARDIANFSAEEEGSSLAWDKVDADTWRVR